MAACAGLLRHDSSFDRRRWGRYALLSSLAQVALGLGVMAAHGFMSLTTKVRPGE